MLKKFIAFSFLFLFLLNSSPLTALEIKETFAPPELQKWQAWVLDEQKDFLCPKDMGQNKLCNWPQYLNLNLNNTGGSFEISWQTFKDESSLILPGQLGAWPINLSDESGKRYPIIGNDAPKVILNKGNYILKGEFSWPEIPETLNVPLNFKILKLNLNNENLPFPNLKTDFTSSALWLKDNSQSANKEINEDNHLEYNITRLISDTNPMVINTRVKVFVSGKARDEVIKNILLPNTTPNALTGPLPAQLDEEGLRLQLQPGIWEFFIEARLNKNIETLGPSESGLNVEYWAFAAQPQLRQVEVSGSPQIDSSQIDINSAWQHLPIYALEKGMNLNFKTLRRGNPEPSPNVLNLNRQCWLDYNGQGLSCYDKLNGEINKQWFINSQKPFLLEHAKLDNQDQVITWQKNANGEEVAGLQLRNKYLNLEADLRINNFNNILPASGWDQNLKSAQQTINLPPAYKLLYVSGAKATNHLGQANTWVSQWQVLDIFLVLIISLAVLKLFGIPWSILSLITMTLIYHEYASPKTVILHLLLTTALLRVIHSKKLISVIKVWRALAIIVLIVGGTMFFLNQAKTALYPQLENPNYVSSGILPLGFSQYGLSYPGTSPSPTGIGEYDSTVYSPQMAESAVTSDEMYSKDNIMDDEANFQSSMPYSSKPGTLKMKNLEPQTKMKQQVTQISQRPEAKVQHGSGRPNWSWRAVYFSFTGEINKEQNIELYFLSPKINFVLNILRIILTMAFFTLLLNLRKEKNRKKENKEEENKEEENQKKENKDKKKENINNKMKTSVAILIFILGFTFFFSGEKLQASENNNFPPQYLLEAYRNKILKPQENELASISHLSINIIDNKVIFIFKSEAAEEAIYNLPILDSELFKSEKLYLEDGRNLNLIANTNGQLLTLIPKGINTFYYEGLLKNEIPFQINFLPNSKPKKIEVLNNNWQYDGLEKNGLLSTNSLYLNPREEQKPENTPTETTKETLLEPYYIVNRTISLGINWQVFTTVTRAKSLGQPSTVKVNLLNGEKPLTGGLKPINNEVVINFSATENSFTWESSLDSLNVNSEETTEIILKANNNKYKEIWRLEAAPIWDVKTEGLTAINFISDNTWQPTWEPWPNENLKLTINNPKPIQGSYLTIDQAKLKIEVNEQNKLNNLNFNIRAGQGGSYSFNLPANAEVQFVKINGQNAPMLSKDKTKETQTLINLFLNPGEQNVEVTWLEAKKIETLVKTPQLDLKVPIANLNLEINLPLDRWLLFTSGPQQGPAVLLWPFLIVLALAAYLLAKTKITPLKFHSWFLLLIGLSGLSFLGAIVVIAWFFILGIRKQRNIIKNNFLFNFSQIILAAWTFLTFSLLYICIKNNLTQLPSMLLKGNFSNLSSLKWFQDRIVNIWPEAWALSLPEKVFQYLMLIWALWLAFSLISWVVWAWQAFSKNHVWKKETKITNN